MANSIFGSNFGFTYDGSTLAVTGAVTSTGNITATGNLASTAGNLGLGSASAGVDLNSNNLRLKPADGGAYVVVTNSGVGVAMNSAPILLQNSGVTQATIKTPSNNTINLTAANGTSAPTLQVGGTPGVNFGPSAVASLTSTSGVVTAAS